MLALLHLSWLATYLFRGLSLPVLYFRVEHGSYCRGMATNMEVGQRVELVGRGGLYGSVAFVGTTLFSPGEWIGAIRLV